jgi:fucose 4-O-acetylase-like acetyltransferase
MMPLFIFTTGKFARKSHKSPLQRSWKMLKTFIIAQVLITLYYGFVLHIISPTKSLLEPRFTLWYLLTCAWLYLSEYLFRKYKFKYVFPISLIIGLFSGFVAPITNFLSLTRTVTSFPMFVLGYYDEEYNFIERAKKYKYISFVLVIGIVIWFFFNQNFFLFKDTYMKYNFYTYRTPFDCFYKRALLYVFYLIFSIFIVNVIPKNKTFLINLGNKTLVIYLLHGVLLKTIKHYKLFISNPIIGTILTYIVVFCLSLLIYYIYDYMKKVGGKLYDRGKTIISKKKLQEV